MYPSDGSRQLLDGHRSASAPMFHDIVAERNSRPDYSEFHLSAEFHDALGQDLEIVRRADGIAGHEHEQLFPP
jgi:hypothetical protein